MATVGHANIILGANVTPLAKGAQQAKQQLAGIGKSANRTRGAMISLSQGASDFTTVLAGGGGLSRALLSSSNNLEVLATRVLPGVGGALAGVGVTLASVAIGFLSLRDNTAKAEDQLKSFRKLAEERRKIGKGLASQLGLPEIKPATVAQQELTRVQKQQVQVENNLFKLRSRLADLQAAARRREKALGRAPGSLVDETGRILPGTGAELESIRKISGKNVRVGGFAEQTRIEQAIQAQGILRSEAVRSQAAIKRSIAQFQLKQGRQFAEALPSVFTDTIKAFRARNKADAAENLTRARRRQRLAAERERLTDRRDAVGSRIRAIREESRIASLPGDERGAARTEEANRRREEQLADLLREFKALSKKLGQEGKTLSAP